MYLVINKCVTAVKVSNFSCHYLRNRSNLDIGVLGYIGIVQHKEHSPEVLSIPPGTLCITLPIVNLGCRLGWIDNATPGRFTPVKRPVTHCIGGWAFPRVGLEKYVA